MIARAFLGNAQVNHVFHFGPDEVEWSYDHNIVSQDTLGGRVVQLLSVKVSQITVNMKAGSRERLQLIAEDMQKIMQWHVETQVPVTFRVPSRKWDFQVYLQAVPQVGGAVDTVTYPFQLIMNVVEDFGIKSMQIQEFEIERLATEIGYTKAFHGGDPVAFQEIVSSLAAFGSAVAGSGSTGSPDGGPPGTPGHWQGKGLWSPKVTNAPWSGSTLKAQIRGAWQSIFDPVTANKAMCIADRESAFTPTANNSYHGPDGTLHFVYGLYQISDVHDGASWWPHSGIQGTTGGLMYDPEYNVRCAMQIYSEEGWIPWSTNGSCS